MRILKIGIENLNSLRLNVSVDFVGVPLGDAGLFAITGDTGAGKTTILDAMTLALYGKVARKADVRELISYGAVECFAEVEFLCSKGTYRAKWGLWRAHKKEDGNIVGPKRELAKWNPKKDVFEIIAQKNKEVDNKVEEVTGLDYDRFSRSVLLSQGDFAAFLKAGEKERSDLLERITGTAIYSALSMGAYKRYKKEEEHLTLLKNKRDQLDLLDEVSEKQYRSDLLLREKESKQLDKNLKQSRSHLNWLNEKKRLELRLESLKTQWTEFEEEKETAIPLFHQLDKHQKASPFETRLGRLDDFKNEKAEQEVAVQNLKTDWDKNQIQKENLKKDFDDRKKGLLLLQKDLSEKESLFDEVIKWDVEIEQKAKPLEKQRIVLSALEADLKAWEKTSKTKEKKLAKLDKELHQVRSWLEANTKLKNLEKDFPLIENSWRIYSELNTEHLALDKTRKEKKKALAATELAYKQSSKSLKVLEKEVENWRAQFKAIVPGQIAFSRIEMLGLLQNEIETLKEEQKNLGQLFELNSSYQQLLTELNAYESELEGLQHEELDVNKQVMNSLEALEATNQRLEFKQQIYEQQLLISNYEKDRTNLPVGEPCPLCFSTKHPFRNRKIKPFTDQAREELNVAKSQHEVVYSEHKRLLRQQNDLELKIEQLSGNDLKALSGRLEKQFEKILTFESKLAGMALLLHKDKFENSTSKVLKIKLLESEEVIVKKEHLRKKLLELDKKLAQKEKEVQAALELERKAASELQLLNSMLSNMEEQLVKVEKQLSEEGKRLEEFLQKNGFKFRKNSAEKRISSLRSQLGKYGKQQERLANLDKDLQLTKLEMTQLARQMAETHSKRKVDLHYWKKESAAWEMLKNERAAKFGDRDPVAERSLMQQQILDKREAFEKLEEALNNAVGNEKSMSTLFAEKQKELGRNTTKIEKLAKELEEQAIRAGFKNRLDLSEALLKQEEFLELQAKKEDLQKKGLEIRKIKTEKETELQLLLAKKKTEATPEELNEVIAEKEAEYTGLQQQIGAINEKLEQNEARKKSARDLFEKIEKQQLEFYRWARLNDVIGQADGKKFRVFAQGLTLRKLIILANKHLGKLSGRYFIEKKSDEDLQLDIVDSYQADNRRSMNTLSGGESFLVSLALALGLSDLAGKDAFIQSLFIDEGFGTLDDATLEMAITTLENLKATGKTIGVISHVNALKERISTQIQVKKSGDGFSVLEIIS